MNIIDTEFERVVVALQKTGAAERKDMVASLGISASILTKIKSGAVTNPTKETLSVLHDYFFQGEGSAQTQPIEMSNENKTEKVN